MSAQSPRATLVLLTYNQRNTLAASVRSALAQKSEPIEILISDDASRYDAKAVVDQALSGYSGPHSVRFNRNDSNLGIAKHLEQAVGNAQGKFIILQAGDDLSEPHRVAALIEAWEGAQPGAFLAYSDFIPVNAGGEAIADCSEIQWRGEHTLDGMMAGQINILGATTAITRDLIENFQPMRPSVVHEDRVLPFRALLAGGTVKFVDQKLVRYRMDGGVSRRSALSAKHFLTKYAQDLHGRLIEDARQRLSDAMDFAAHFRDDVIGPCRASVVEHEAYLRFATDPSPERAFLLAVNSGARTRPMLAHYAKHRLFWLFSLYYRLRWQRPLAGEATPTVASH